MPQNVLVSQSVQKQKINQYLAPPYGGTAFAIYHGQPSPLIAPIKAAFRHYDFWSLLPYKPNKLSAAAWAAFVISDQFTCHIDKKLKNVILGTH